MKNFKHTFHNTIEEHILFEQGIIKNDYILKDLTSFKIGGKADFFFEPLNIKQLNEGLDFFLKNKIPLSIIGDANNLLISDKGITGVVLNLKNFNKIKVMSAIQRNEMNEEFVFVEAGAGVLIDNFVNWAIENSLEGIEDFAGLPSSVGGACFMNARCYDRSISDIIYSAEILVIDKMESCIKYKEYSFIKNDWAYKKSPFQKNAKGIQIDDQRQIILSAIFKLKKGNQSQIEKRANYCKKDREKKGHFKAPSAGSMFKNNRDFGIPSGKIIEEVGLKGFSVGDAQVAPWHGNFVINKENASSDSVIKLIKYVQKTVKEKTGFCLEPEVIICGN